MSGLSVAQASRAVRAYRAVLKAHRFTFKDDAHALLMGKRTARKLMGDLKNIPSAKVDEQIDNLFLVAKIFRENVVQGIKTEEGNYRLRMTEETERGDNSTIKAPSKSEARPMRPPIEPAPGNEGVRRRRRRKPEATPVSQCCSSVASSG